MVSMTSGKLQCSVKRMQYSTTKDLIDFTLQHFEALKVILPSCFCCLPLWLVSSSPYPVLFSQIGYLECLINC